MENSGDLSKFLILLRVGVGSFCASYMPPLIQKPQKTRQGCSQGGSGKFTWGDLSSNLHRATHLSVAFQDAWRECLAQQGGREERQLSKEPSSPRNPDLTEVRRGRFTSWFCFCFPGSSCFYPLFIFFTTASSPTLLRFPGPSHHLLAVCRPYSPTFSTS